MGLTRIFFATDVHGSNLTFMKFLNAAKHYGANILILGGDLTGKYVVPVVQQSDGTYVADYLGNDHILRTVQEREDLEANIRNIGYYPYLTTPTEMEKLRCDQKLVDELFSKLMVDQVKHWISVADERLKGSKVKCYISPGNDDRFVIDEVLRSSVIVLDAEGDVVWLDDSHEMITSGWTNLTPWHSPRETSEDELAEKLNGMISKVEWMENCIFNLHAPPYHTAIDLAPEIDETHKPKIGSEIKMAHVGSRAVRDAIEREQPLLGLHGHVHESNGFAKIGRTLCINPGTEYGEGLLRGAIINLDETGIKSHLLVTGA
jgi:Icc-related predicted phosphoesterase